MVNVNEKCVAAAKVNMFNKAWRSARVMMQGARKEKTLGSYESSPEKKLIR